MTGSAPRASARKAPSLQPPLATNNSPATLRITAAGSNRCAIPASVSTRTIVAETESGATGVADGDRRCQNNTKPTNGCERQE